MNFHSLLLVRVSSMVLLIWSLWATLVQLANPPPKSLMNSTRILSFSQEWAFCVEFNFLSCSALVILIFSLDLFGFDVADLWPKCQFDSLNFEGIIRFEVSFFPFLFIPSYCSCTGKGRESWRQWAARTVHTAEALRAGHLRRTWLPGSQWQCFFREYNEDATYSHASYSEHTYRHVYH